MRVFLTTILFALIATPAIATDNDELRFNQAYREFAAAVASGDSRRSIAAGKATLDIGNSFLEPDDPRRAEIRHDYAYALIVGGQVEKGREILEQSIDALIESSGKKSPELISAYVAMASAYSGFGKESQQLRWYKRALSVVSSNFGKSGIDYANVAYLTGARVYDESQSAAGEKYLKKALVIYEAELGASSKEAGLARYQLGLIAFFRRDSREVTEYLLQALNSFKGDDPADQEQRLKIHAMLVQAFEALEESDNATRHCVAIGRESQLAPDQDFVPLFVVTPQYPHTQWRNGVEGHVVLSFTVDEFGFVQDPEVVEAVSVPTGRRSFRSSFRDPVEHQSFEASALAALKRYRYAPRFVDGIAVPTEGVTTRTNFRIVDKGSDSP